MTRDEAIAIVRAERERLRMVMRNDLEMMRKIIHGTTPHLVDVPESDERYGEALRLLRKSHPQEGTQ